MKGHISNDQLIAQLYGLESHESHFAECADCRGRYQALSAKRVQIAAPQEVSTEFLATQRRAVYERMGEKPHAMRVWAPAFATAALVAFVLLSYVPRANNTAQRSAVSVVKQADISDSQLFSDVVSFEQAMDQAEPRAIAPIHGLFEERE